MTRAAGRRLPVSLPRRWIADLMWVSRGRPIITFERRMRLAAVAAARSRTKIAWSLLFTKAFALVAKRTPELRRAIVPFPWPHLFECGESLVSFALERDFQGEQAVFFGMIRGPENQSLMDMQAVLHRWKTAPIDEVNDFRRLVRYSRLPLPLRRFFWWYAMSVSGRVRAINYGTYGVSITASAGAGGLNLIAPVTTTLNYGPFDDQFALDVRLHFDHRVYDGMTAARALAEMEQVLNIDILAELQAFA